MLELLANKMRKRHEVATDVEPVVTRMKASRQSQEDWIQLAEKLTQSPEAAGQPGDGV